ncbi:MAG: dimethylsulfonioproprionate lyase family protein [Sulfitobacter sp.]
MSAFCAFPDDLEPQDVRPFHIPSADLLYKEHCLFSEEYSKTRDAFVAAGPAATWRETYKDTDIGTDFMDRFGCYCLIGEDGAFTSTSMAAWVVYMPAKLYYTWHQHPAEEMYMTLAGEATFMRKGCEDKVLRAGGTSLHASNQPHAMQTHDHPVMAYVVWRNGFTSPPVLTCGEVSSF